MNDFQARTRKQLLDMPLNTPFTLEEVALYRGKTVRTVQRAIASGKLKCSRSGGVCVLKAWVCEWIDAEWDEKAKAGTNEYLHS